MTTLPDFPSVAAVIVAEPGEAAVTTPVGLTDATPIADDVQVRVGSATTFPRRSRTLAFSGTVWPMLITLTGDDTTTDATTGACCPVGASPPPHATIVAIQSTRVARSVVAAARGEGKSGH
jgi:hypothetical protein